jgi:hypothetical protein
MTRIAKKQKAVIFERAVGCCEYCMSPASFSSQAFSIEHIYPKHLGGADSLDNLALSCQGCNEHKATRIEWRDPTTGVVAPLYNPRRQRWDEHFAWKEDFSIVVGLTPTGRATIDALHLNREGLVNLRQALRYYGVHPPALSGGRSNQ